MDFKHTGGLYEVGIYLGCQFGGRKVVLDEGKSFWSSLEQFGVVGVSLEQERSVWSRGYVVYIRPILRGGFSGKVCHARRRPQIVILSGG